VGDAPSHRVLLLFGGPRFLQLRGRIRRRLQRRRRGRRRRHRRRRRLEGRASGGLHRHLDPSEPGSRPRPAGKSSRMEKGQVNLVTIVIIVLVVLGVIFLITRL
jgi:hypothetical protein